MKRIALITMMLLCGAALMLTGCGKGKMIDGRNAQTFQQSYNEMTKNMSPDRKAKLDEAVEKIMNNSRARYIKMGCTPMELNQLLYVDFDEMTADDILKKANELNN